MSPLRTSYQLPVSESTSDPNGNLSSIKDAKGNSTTYTYDALNPLTSPILFGEDDVPVWRCGIIRVPGRQEEHTTRVRSSMSIDHKAIAQLARQIGSRYHPEKILLVGSYAYGRPTNDSDVDLMIILTTKKRNIRQAVDIACAMPHPFPMDLIVLKPRDVQRRLRGGDMALREMVTKGRVLYEARHKGMAEESRR
jgi:predicted nucleotidyltransferase